MSTVLYVDENHKCIKFDDLVGGAAVAPSQFLFVLKRKEWVSVCGRECIKMN